MDLINNGACLPYGIELTDGAVLLYRPEEFGALERYAIGLTWNVVPINIDLLSETEILRMADDVRAILSHLPEGSVLDLRVDYRPKYSAESWESIRVDIDNAHTNLVRAHIAQGMPHRPRFNHMSLVECAVTVGFRFALAQKAPLVTALIDGLRQLAFWRAERVSEGIKNRIEAEFQDGINSAQTHAESIESGLRQLEMAPERLSGDRLLSTLNRALGPGGYRHTCFNPDEPISDQLSSPSVMAPDHIESGDYEAGIFVLRQSIGRTYPGILSAPRTPDVKARGISLVSLQCPLSISVTICAQPQTAIRTALGMKLGVANFVMKGILGEDRPEVKATKEALDELVAGLSAGHDYVYAATVIATLWHEKGKPSQEANFIRQTEALNIRWYKEAYLADTVFVRSLPMGMDFKYPSERLVRRARQIPTEPLSHLVPLWGSFRGTNKTPTALFLNQQGEPITIDFFDLISPHAIITGATRRGKSSFANMYIMQALGLGTHKVYVLDRYASYDQITKELGGKLIKFDSATPICVGPFDGDLGQSHQAHIAMIVEEMMTAGLKGFSVTPEERVRVGDLIGSWAKESPTVRTIGDFDRFLGLHHDDFAEHLRLLLSPFVGQGRYAAYVDGPNDLEIGDTDLWVADVKGLDETPALQAVIIATLFTTLERHITLPENYLHKKLFLADEVSFLLKNAQAAEFFQRLSVALARFFCSFTLISQQPSDFLSEVGAKSVKNADTHIFFNLSNEELIEIQEIFGLSDHTLETITRLRRYEDCSECVVRFRDGETGILRVVPPPDFIERIGQARHHVEARLAKEESAA